MIIGSWLKSIFLPDVDSVVAEAKAKIAKLNIVAEGKRLEAEVADKAVAEATKLSTEAKAEIAKAKAAIAKFEAAL